MAYIKNIEYYLPEKTLTNTDLVKEFPEWDADKVSQKVGIEVRHIAGTNETASDLAFKAAKELIEKNSIDKNSIDFLLFCTQSPDFILPTSACLLQKRLELPNTCGALDYNLGCSGAIYGLGLASSLIDSGNAKNVLLITAETYSKYLHTSDKSNRSIFGDGAAACLISKSGFAEIGRFIWGTDGSGYDKLIIKTGASREPVKTGKEIEDADGHIWRDDYLYMNGSGVFNFTLEIVPKLINDVMITNEINSYDEISLFVLHQANKFMLQTIRKLCQIPKDKFFIDLIDKGNTVSSTCLIALKDAINKGLLKEGDKCLMAGFGVGLSYSGCILKIV